MHPKVEKDSFDTTSRVRAELKEIQLYRFQKAHPVDAFRLLISCVKKEQYSIHSKQLRIYAFRMRYFTLSQSLFMLIGCMDKARNILYSVERLRQQYTTVS